MQRGLVQVAASCLVILFVYAGLSKLLDYSLFRFELGRSPYVTALAGWVAWVVPVVEIVVAVLLTVPKTRLAGFYASFFVLTMFTGYIYLMLNYSPYLPCSCGGVLSTLSWKDHIYFNIVFIIVSICGVTALYSGKTIKTEASCTI